METAALNGANMAAPLRQASNVRQTGTRQYAGTIDRDDLAAVLNVPTPGTTPRTSPSAARAAIAFTAELDEQGRLIRYHVDAPRNKGGTYPMDLTFTDFGTAVTVQPPPAGQIAVAPAR